MKIAKNYAEKSGQLSAYIDMIAWEVKRMNDPDATEWTHHYDLERITDLVKTAKEISDTPIHSTY